ncbi:type I restriction endonuclease subunit M [Calothrix sp. HK-06]|nr:type I restriction endonuclease subunit M [Calothrix sp. HK-06]
MVASLELRKPIQSLLQNLNNIKILKELFCSQLNYDYKNEELPSRKLTEAVTDEIKDKPLLLASGGVNRAFHIIYTRLKSENLSKQSERVIVNHLLQEYPYALFVFSNVSQSHWHFLNVKYDTSLQKRRLFRRITIGDGEQLRTATERISLLDLEKIPNATPLDIQNLHDEAFDVEKVTQEFFREYRKTFEKVESLIKWSTDSESKRLFTQKLFNRLMFIAFIEKKSWLKFNQRTDYLSALWESYENESEKEDKNFYKDKLSHLFFSGLNRQEQDTKTDIKNLIGSVPYLNGGLFEQGEDDKNQKIVIPDDCIDTILHDLFQRFAFTVTESTPLDVEVAVDPEMLGKVFEELVTGRHESGSYYTPKAIVSFMCREALKGYLKTEVASELPEAVAQLVDEHNANNLVNAEEILKALQKVRCCDLAAGSGAYLLGMLHELLDLRQCLFVSNGLDSNNVYQRKLEIIENNIYGIDKDVFAVNIARLRLWLSLAVEYQGEKPNPLPNLKYKIEVGDSLTAPSPKATGMIRHELISQYSQKKAEYMRTHEGHKKRKLEDEIKELKKQIRLVTNGSTQEPEGFDWAVEFAEVFADKGFDILISNPPYVRQELIKDLKPTLQKVYPATYNGTSDLYCFFYTRALQLLKPNGMLAFISPNKWFRAKYGDKLKQHIAETCQVYSITDFGELPVFKSAATFPMIFIAQNGKIANHSTLFTQVKSLEPPYPNLLEIIQYNGQVLLKDAIKGSDWVLTDSNSANRLQKMEAVGSSLLDYTNNQIYSGIKTGFNKAFHIDGTTREKLILQDINSTKIIKPLAVGDNVRRWRTEDKNKWIIVTNVGVDIEKYPAIFAYLNQWKNQLINRSDQGNHWWELRPCAYYSAFESPKIVFPDIAKESRFTLDYNGIYADMTAFVIPLNDLYLLGVLNSKHVWSYLCQKAAILGDAEKGGRIRLKRTYVKKIPIPNASTSERQAISKLVQKCLDAKGAGCEHWEKEINERVAALYGL